MSRRRARKQHGKETENVDHKSGSILGQCLSMCPHQEVLFRMDNKMVHELEDNGRTCVKKFSRSAAGTSRVSAKDLRPPSVCLKTAIYLIEKLFLERCGDAANGSLKVYDFVFDRLRAVRQDLAIQDSVNGRKEEMFVYCLCVKFHLLCGYEYAENPLFDANFNFVQLRECLKHCIVLLHTQDSQFESTLSGNMASVYLLLNLGSYEALNWCLQLPTSARMSPVISRSFSISQLYLQNNFVAMFRKIKAWPGLLQRLAIHWNLPAIYSRILAVMSSAYNGKVSLFPLDKFSSLFLVDGVSESRDLCQLHGLDTPQGIKFIKSSFHHTEVTRKKWGQIEELLLSRDRREAFSIFFDLTSMA